MLRHHGVSQHRLSLLRRADVILVIEKGRLTRMGSHDELVKLDGPYRETALLQLMDLEEEAEESPDDESTETTIVAG